MELIPVSKKDIGGEAVNSVNARELHLLLGVKTHISTWIKRAIEKYGFDENIDFSVLKSGNPNGGLPIIDYIVSIDMAKELCMLDDSDKGRQFRKYFIECEEQAKSTFQIPQTYSEALMLAAKQAEQIEQQTALIEAQKPKVEFYEAVTGSSDTIDIASVAKVLNIKGFGRNNLFEFLRDKNILMQNNQPFQTFVDRGYFRVIESKYNKPDGSSHINLKTVVYQKGLDYIRKLLETEK